VVRMGKISYGLYILHLMGILILMDLAHPRWGWRLLATKALRLVMTVLRACASYRWIESPFLPLKDRFATVLSRPVGCDGITRNAFVFTQVPIAGELLSRCPAEGIWRMPRVRPGVYHLTLPCALRCRMSHQESH
jgi:hypothetical protein